LNLGDSYARPPEKGEAGPPNGRNVPKMGYRGDRPMPPGLKPKDLVGIPWRVALALQADGWLLRSDIIWHKPNPMPEPVQDRPTKCHEYVFLLSKSERYYYDAKAVREPCVSLDPEHPSYRPSSVRISEQGRKTYEAKVKSARVYNPEGRNRRTVWTVTTCPYKGAHFATYPEALVAPCVLAGSPVGGVVLDPFNGAGTTALAANARGRFYVGVELNEEYAGLTVERWKRNAAHRSKQMRS
jgi:DNA modification methylase